MVTMNDLSQNKRALAYVRISSQRQINGESPETQKTKIQSYADNNGIEIVEWFFDEAKSGKNTDRIELQSLLKKAKQYRGEIDHVLVYKMNRASRDITTYIMGFRFELQSMGITIRSATEQFDDSPMGHFMEMLQVMVGQVDNENKRDFTVDNMRALAEQGYWQHPPVVGYDIAKVANSMGKSRPTLKLNAMSGHVKQVLERFSEGDITKAKLTRYAFDIGLRSRYGARLSPDAINRLLTSPVYAGYIADKFTNYELVTGKHPRIISPDTYEFNRKLLQGGKRTGEIRLKFNPEYPLKGLILCPKCNKALYASAPKTGGGGKSPRYHCSRKTCKGIKSIKADVIHNAFLKMLEGITPSNGVMRLYREVLIQEAMNRSGNVNKKIKDVNNKLEAIADKRLKVVRMLTEGALTVSEKNEQTELLDNEKQIYIDEKESLMGKQSTQEADIDKILDIMESIPRQWLNSDLATQQRFQNLLFPKGLVYDYKNELFGTSQLSDLYRYTLNKKDLPVSEKSFLVAGVGFEPTTLWL
jgi:site-specific DNA recombinase